MRIIRLEAENVKRLRAVGIDPDGTVQVVTGRNAQGKSSVLDAIWLALGGGQASRDIPVPIRDGQDGARVMLDLGDLRVTRTWDRRKGTELRVEAPDGGRYPSPQTLLDRMVGKLSFDPLAFTRLKPAEQRQALLDLLGLDFADADAERARLYDRRLETGRRAHAFGDLPKIPDGAPMVDVSARPVMDQVMAAQQAAEALRKRQAERAALAAVVDRWTARVEDARRDLARAEKELVQANAELADLDQQPALADGDPLDELDRLRAELDGIEERNRAARANQELANKHQAQQDLQQAYTALTHQIEAIDRRKAETLAAASMPVDGLGFDEQGVTFGGVPFAQASSAEQIRVSLAMAMALNPTLRVVRIMDGSLLDADSMATITAMATAHDMQVWIERVEDGSPTAVVIEDGSVVAP